MELFQNLQSNYAIDSRPIYVTGYSLGGIGTYDFVLNRPDLFAAAVPVAGGRKADDAFWIRHVPLWMFHGETDGTIPASFDRDVWIGRSKLDDAIRV